MEEHLVSLRMEESEEAFEKKLQEGRGGLLVEGALEEELRSLRRRRNRRTRRRRWRRGSALETAVATSEGRRQGPRKEEQPCHLRGKKRLQK